jgi:hypothetical protein
MTTFVRNFVHVSLAAALGIAIGSAPALLRAGRPAKQDNERREYGSSLTFTTSNVAKGVLEIEGEFQIGDPPIAAVNTEIETIMVMVKTFNDNVLGDTVLTRKLGVVRVGPGAEHTDHPFATRVLLAPGVYRVRVVATQPTDEKGPDGQPSLFEGAGGTRTVTVN